MRDLINQTRIWIFVGSVSAINGLVCFLLSSTYNMLFGKWGIGGLPFYILISSIMFYLIWRVKRIPVPERHQGPVKALIFVVICSISVLLDKLLPGKSDAWSLISYASFALMSLSTSTKSELGFETGFFSFFLSLFVEQLCKTNLKFSPIAVVFCLVVLILRHYSASGVQSGSVGYHHVEVGPPNAAVIDIGDDDEVLIESQDSPGMGEVSGQSLLSARNQQNNQEEPSQATHHSPRTEAVPRQESTSDRGSEQNNEQAEEDPSSLAAESRDQERVPSGNNDVTTPIRETHPVSELSWRGRRWMPRGIPNMSTRVEHTLGQLRRQLRLNIDGRSEGKRLEEMKPKIPTL